MSDWNASPPKGAPMVDVPWLGAFYPPDAASQGKKPSPPSSAVEGLKRTLGRIGAWPWDPNGYDQDYSNAFAHGSSRGPGVEAVQAWAKISPTGWIGKPTWNFLRSVLVQDGKPHEGEHAMDAKAADLIRQAASQPPQPGDDDPGASAQRMIQDYCRRALANIANWHYRQYRPMQSLGDSPDGIIYSDCSEGVTAAYYWAGAPDPNGNGYDGSGYTETLWANNPRVSPPYRVGDLALYTSNGGHVTVCIEAGDVSSSRWWSNGSEGGPYAEDLYYRADVRGVVRPTLLG